MSSPMKESSSSFRPAAQLWVPSVQEWSAMSWHQRQQFVMSKRVVLSVPELIPCEKSHVEDLPGQPPPGPWDEVRMHHEMELMRRRKEARQAAKLAAEVVTPEMGDRNWNVLAEAIGNWNAMRYEK